MNDSEQQICRFCAEIISAKAKLCPRCRQWLTMKSFRNPTVGAVCFGVPLMACFVLGALAVLSRIDRLQHPKPYYSEFPDSVRVLESHMNWTVVRDELRIYIAGVLTNSSPVTWKDAEFDCRFFDAKGAMIDTATGFGHFTISPNDDAAFRVSITPTAPTNSYASFKISVSHARNSRSWF